LHQVFTLSFFIAFFVVVLTDERVVVFFGFLWVGTGDLKMMIKCT
jgi:hypothetical protein